MSDMSIDASAASIRKSAVQVGDCAACPLRALPQFLPVNATELGLIQELKRAEFELEADSLLITEGSTDTPLYTLLSGWAFRFKTLPDGRRQILNFLLPGDFIGLQQKMTDAYRHGVRTLTAVRVCSFQRDALWALHRELPSLGYDLTWLAARGEHLVDENLLTVGRRSAKERVAALLLTLHQRAMIFQHGVNGRAHTPLTQLHLADALGLSRVHVQRTVRTLARQGLCDWAGDGHITLPDPEGLARVAHLPWPLPADARPLI